MSLAGNIMLAAWAGMHPFFIFRDCFMTFDNLSAAHFKVHFLTRRWLNGSSRLGEKNRLMFMSKFIISLRGSSIRLRFFCDAREIVCLSAAAVRIYLHFLNEPLCMCVHLRVRMFILGCAVNLV